MENKTAAKRAHNLTEEQIQLAKQMAGYGMKNEEIARVFKCSPHTISKYRKHGFDQEEYRKEHLEQNRRYKDKTGPAPEPEKKPEQLGGQMTMDLTPAEEPKPEMSDQTKLMRFQAHEADLIMRKMEEQVNQITLKLDKINDTLCMIIRCIRRE